MDITPIGYQGAAQHTYTPGCDGFHVAGPCPEVARTITIPPGTFADGAVVELHRDEGSWVSASDCNLLGEQTHMVVGLRYRFVPGTDVHEHWESPGTVTADVRIPAHQDEA